VEAFRRARCKDDALNSTLGGATAAYALVGIHRECRAESPTSPHDVAVGGFTGATHNENHDERAAGVVGVVAGELRRRRLFNLMAG
jgi:hypothetical protein